MTKEDPSRIEDAKDENLDPTHNEERESEETSEDIESLLPDDSQEDAPVTRKEFNQIINGVKRLAGKVKEPKVEEKKEEKTAQPKTRDRLAEEVLISKIPELGKSESAMESIRIIAEKTGLDIFTVVEQNEWIIEKAQSEAKREGNKNKVSDPAGDVREDADAKLQITKEDRRIADKFFGGNVKRYLKYKQSNQ